MSLNVGKVCNRVADGPGIGVEPTSAAFSKMEKSVELGQHV